MSDRFAPRFLLEAAFLVLLALAAGLAELATLWIVLVMVAGWLLVALVEWLAWRSEQQGDDEAEAPSREPVLGETTDWDLDDIIAPVPEDEDVQA